MKLLGRPRLDRLRGGGEQQEKWLRSWANEVQSAQWKHAADVREQFPGASQVTERDFIFPVGDCGWSICLQIAFPQGVALITELKAEDEQR